MTENARPRPPEGIPAELEIVIVTRLRQIVDDFKVRRALPSAKRRMVGPFIFMDQLRTRFINFVVANLTYNDFRYSTKSFFSWSVKLNFLKPS